VRWTRCVCAVLVATAGVACTSTSGGGKGSPGVSPAVGTNAPPGGASSTFDPSRFSPDVTNPWFPLPVGRTLVYRGTKDEQHAVDYLTVSRQTVKIAGVPCRVVLDKTYLEGKLGETTRDYYTQDSNGNVWYFGEDTAEIDAHGNMVSTEGTWHTGEAGARPGIFMPADPKVGESHAQEYYPGHAQDFFQVLDLSSTVHVPYGRFDSALLTKEWTPLEPGVLDHKYYARGIGTVREVTVTGGHEEFVLVSITGA
jgi:hypothetical protein